MNIRGNIFGATAIFLFAAGFPAADQLLLTWGIITLITLRNLLGLIVMILLVFLLERSIFTIDGLRHIIMPAINLSLFKISMVIRLTRAGVEEVMALDFIKFARARGLSSQRIIRSHLLPNILIPIITVLAIEFGTLIAFATVTESIFAWPGVGKLVIDAIVNLDRPIVVAYLLFVVTLFLVLNLIVDILYAALDPRVRLQGGRE